MSAADKRTVTRGEAVIDVLDQLRAWSEYFRSDESGEWSLESPRKFLPRAIEEIESLRAEVQRLDCYAAAIRTLIDAESVKEKP